MWITLVLPTELAFFDLSASLEITFPSTDSDWLILIPFEVVGIRVRLRVRVRVRVRVSILITLSHGRTMSHGLL